MSQNLNIQKSIAALRQRSDAAAQSIITLADLVKQENWETEDEPTENDRVILHMLRMVSQRMRCQLKQIQDELNKINNKISDIALLSENNAVNENEIMNEIMAVSWRQEMLHQRLNSLSATLNAVHTTTSYMLSKRPAFIGNEISIDYFAPTITICGEISIDFMAPTITARGEDRIDFMAPTITARGADSIDFMAPTITSKTENFTVSSPISVFTGTVVIDGTLMVKDRVI